jgi:UDP-N-acetyl-D-mannosaminuronate dehydrogenase
MHPVSDIEIAELTKIIENAHRYLQIAFAEDLYLYCQANNINFAELRDSLNTKWNVNILEPREGIGGHCLPKDTTMFLNSSKSIKSKIIQAAIQVDAEYRMYRIINKSYQLTTEATKYVGLRETTCQSTQQVHPPGKSLLNLFSAGPHPCSCIHK